MLPGVGVLILTRDRSQTDSDDESNFCIEVRDADETTDNPDILTLLEDDLDVGERLEAAVGEKLRTVLSLEGNSQFDSLNKS